MSNVQKAMNYIARFLLGLILIGLSLKQMQEKYNLIKTGQDNISKSKNFFYKLKFYDLNRIYALIPVFISTMNYTLLLTGLLLIIKIMDNLFLMNYVMLIQLLLINNIFLDHSSKCYLMASAYIGIYGVFLSLRN